MNKMVPRLGWIIGIALALVPLLLWLPTAPFNTYTQDARHLYGTLAKVGALSGTALFCYTFLLGARLPWVEWMFGGLDKVYVAHRRLGKSAFYLIFMHALFLSLRSTTTAGRGLSGLWLSDNWKVQFGVIAFWGMVAAIFISTVVHVKHQTFVRVHDLLGPLFLLGAFHAYAIGSQLGENQALQLYMIVLIVIATWAYLYQVVLGRWLIKKYKYVVQEVHLLADNITEVIMRPVWRPFNFTPGQFGFVTFEDPAVDDEAHPYALCSNPHDRQLRVVVKNLGDYTAQLRFLTPGSKAYVEGPHGAFSYLNAKSRRQVWVAGGIGITPFLAMARSLPKRSRYHLDLYYCTKTKAEMVFARELRKIAKSRPYLKLKTVCEATDGFLTAETMARGSGGLTDKEFYICGPPVMMKALRGQLEKAGVEPNLIHTEEFAFR